MGKRNLVHRSLVALGLIIALFGAGADYILPTSSPGLNLPQLLVIAAGLSLAWGAGRLARGLREHGGKAIAIALFTLLALELILTAAGTTVYFPTEASNEPLKLLDWRICDDDCRINPAGIAEYCVIGKRGGRPCDTNAQGYPDHEDFTLEDIMNRPRILFLGDSFTQGYAADAGRAYVELIKRRLPQAVIWNAAMSGEGTNQAVGTFGRLAPQMQPDLTIYGLYMNDFDDNLYPL